MTSVTVLQKSLPVSLSQASAPMDLDSSARMPSPTQLVANDDDLNTGNSLIDLIKRANASIRDHFSHHVMPRSETIFPIM